MGSLTAVTAAAVAVAGDAEVRPGEAATVTVTVTNVGPTVEAYQLIVLGPLAPFTTASPGEVRLLPGEQAVAALTVLIGTDIDAGPVPFAVKVEPRTTPGEAVVEELELQVAAAARFEVRPVPSVVRARRRGKVRLDVENTGNTPVTVALVAEDPNEELMAVVRPARLTVPPHTVGCADVRLRSLVRRGASISYKIGARTDDGAAVEADARMETPRRRPVVLLAAAAVILMAVVVVATQLRGGDSRGVRLAGIDGTTAPAEDSTTSTIPVAGSVAVEGLTTKPTGTTQASAVPPTTGPLGPQGSPAPTTAPTTRTVSPPPPVTRGSTTTRPPCTPQPCSTIVRNSGDNRVLDTRLAGASANGNPILVTSTSQPAHGTTSIRDGGATVYYRPAPDYLGRDSFTFAVSDGDGANTATMDINVVP